MAMPKNYTHKAYMRYAEPCLTMVTTIKDRRALAINREIAPEWLKLAHAILHPLTGKRSKGSQRHLWKARAIQT
jgi:hypothetical protein